MPFKINISSKDGKTYKLELESEELVGKELGQKIKGNEVLPALEGYELEITGTSDKAGFTSMADIEGVGLTKKLLTYGKGMKKRPKHEGKHKRAKNRPKGLRLRKTVRGKVISDDIVQINMKILKEGKKLIADVFPDQNKPKVEEAPASKEETKPEGEAKKE